MLNIPESEIKRLSMMLKHESCLYSEGYSLIAGVDEAGRGPLAGPVVASSVILRKNDYIQGLDDSKKLTEKQRDELYSQVCERAIAIEVAIADNELIDHINILRATLFAMKHAILKLQVEPDFILVDGTHSPDLCIPTKTIVDGDSKSLSIAAASVIAKVTRDRIMNEFHKIYPQYGFNQHKGYPTSQHFDAISKFGVCAIHRTSFNLTSNRNRTHRIPRTHQARRTRRTF